MSHDIELSEKGSTALFVAAGIAEAMVLPPHGCIHVDVGADRHLGRDVPLRGPHPILPDDVAPLEQLLLDLSNRERIGAGLPLLIAHAPLMDVARRHTLDMGLRLELFHSDPHEHQGFRCCPRCWIGENVGRIPDGRGLVLGSVEPWVSVEMIHRTWMTSSEHRANVLEPGFRVIGVSAVQGADLRFYATQVFAG